jgi:Glutathione S-transferase, C-terminal domain
VLSYGIGARPGDYYPGALRTEIDRANAPIYDTQQPVYKASFAGTQEAYEAAVVPLFESLDWLEERLGKNRFLVGGQPTEADWRLFTTLVRFDPGAYRDCVPHRVCHPAWGLVSFIWPSRAPTSSTGDEPPIFSWMRFQLHPFSRSMSRSFSVNGHVSWPVENWSSQMFMSRIKFRYPLRGPAIASSAPTRLPSACRSRRRIRAESRRRIAHGSPRWVD